MERANRFREGYLYLISLTLAWLRDYRNYIEVRISVFEYVGPISPRIYIYIYYCFLIYFSRVTAIEIYRLRLLLRLKNAIISLNDCRPD